MKKSEMPLYRQELQEGQAFLANQIRILFSNKYPGLYDLIGRQSDVYLEPLLFAYFGNASSTTPIEQVVYGYIPITKRPLKINVYSDGAGIIEIPQIGYIKADKKNKILNLEWNKETGQFTLSDQQKVVRHRLVKKVSIPGTQITFCQYPNELLARLFINESGLLIKALNSPITPKKIAQLSKAFSLIQKIVPEYYQAISNATKRVYLYGGDKPYSFASVKAHGIAFIKTDNSDDELFFCEDLIHQCGHIIFSSIAVVSPFFLINGETVMADVAGGQINDNRTIFTALHGLFTEGWMNLFFYSGLGQRSFSGAQLQELIGRFTLILTRFSIDLRFFYYSDILNEKGRELVDHLFQLYLKIINEFGKTLAQVQITDQPYCFDRKVFFESNTEILL